MNCERDIRYELLARLCPNATGADIRSVCTEAGMYAIRDRRKVRSLSLSVLLFASVSFWSCPSGSFVLLSRFPFHVSAYGAVSRR